MSISIPLFLMCFLVGGVGVSFWFGASKTAKYLSDRETYDVIAAYRFNGTCHLVSSSIYSVADDCAVLLYQVELRPQGSDTFLDGYHAFSNFFPDTCGGVRPRTFSGRNITRQCWYRNLTDTRVRLVPLDSFEAEPENLYMGAALVATAALFGILPLSSLLRCCWALFSTICDPSHTFDAGRRRVAALGEAPPRGPVIVATHAGSNPTGSDHEPSKEIHITELSPTSGDWSGRLICKTDFAAAAVRRFQTMDRFKFEECPLCFRNFGGCVVWWTCGHFVCDECNPRILAAEQRWGHLLHPRCPLCRERSDINDIVKVKLKLDGEEVRGAASQPEATDEGVVKIVFVDGGPVPVPDNYSLPHQIPL